ncbi:MAG: cyclic pyranopterin monophosphate synthase MoaC [Thermodesulfovibrionia bacterium]|nr:cyclic pyranopterin monophosphate synthase MoaC [Thermodesulfovibrionia bacterium]
MKKLTHIDEEGRMNMVDVSGKSSTLREAIASGSISMEKETLKLITDGKITKGNVLEAARLAGIMAAKKTCELIPLCHQINLSTVSIDFKIDRKKSRINIEAKAKCKGETGVEMEALVAASAAALTIYDMCKAVDRGMVISDIMLIKKSGGKSGTWERK